MSPAEPAAALPPLIEAAVRDTRSRRPLPERAVEIAALGLWLPASWAVAQRMGIGEEEYARWIGLGRWNLDGDPGVKGDVEAYRAAGGSRGWILAAAGMSPEEAKRQARAEGREAVLDAAEALIALKGLAEGLPEADRWTPPEPEREPESGPLDFT